MIGVFKKPDEKVNSNRYIETIIESSGEYFARFNFKKNDQDDLVFYSKVIAWQAIEFNLLPMISFDSFITTANLIPEIDQRYAYNFITRLPNGLPKKGDIINDSGNVATLIYDDRLSFLTDEFY